MDPKREKFLIDAAKRGDTRAFGELYDAYIDSLYRYFVLRCKDHQVAEDLAGEVFLHFMEGIASYQERGVSLLGWLYHLAHDRLVDYYRHSKVVGVEANIDKVALPTEDEADNELMKTYQIEKIRAALSTLKEDQRQVLLLRFIEGYNLQQTAETLGKTVGAVKVIQHRALQALNAALTRQDLIYE